MFCIAVDISRFATIVIPPANFLCGGVYCFHVVRPSVCPSVTLCFFPNILKRSDGYSSISADIDISKMYLHKVK